MLLGDLDAVDPLLHEHALGDVRVHDRRDAQVLELAHEPRDDLGRMCLLDEVELSRQVGLELVGERRELQQARGLGAVLGHRRERAQEIEIERDLLSDPRPPHFHDDLAAAPGERPVDLADRR